MDILLYGDWLDGKKTAFVRTLQKVESLIFAVRGMNVILDSDLAGIFGVPTKRLNEQVRRNAERFPVDFCFKLTQEEWTDIEFLRSQNATLKKGRGQHRKYFPYVFTEHGAIMAANVLKTKRAVQMSIFVVRAFVRLREFLSTHKELAQKLKELEQKVGKHDEAIQAIVETIRQLMHQPIKPKRRIGFRVEEKKRRYGTKR